jgi:hypothetical protein
LKVFNDQLLMLVDETSEGDEQEVVVEIHEYE